MDLGALEKQTVGAAVNKLLKHAGVKVNEQALKECGMDMGMPMQQEEKERFSLTITSKDRTITVSTTDPEDVLHMMKLGGMDIDSHEVTPMTVGGGGAGSLVPAGGIEIDVPVTDLSSMLGGSDHEEHEEHEEEEKEVDESARILQLAGLSEAGATSGDYIDYVNMKGEQPSEDLTGLPGVEYDPDTGIISVRNATSLANTHRAIEAAGWQKHALAARKNPASNRQAGIAGDTAYQLESSDVEEAKEPFGNSPATTNNFRPRVVGNTEDFGMTGTGEGNDQYGKRRAPGQGDNPMGWEDMEESYKSFKAQKLDEAKKAKPDFLDVDKDGDKKEPMKKALKDKEEVKESQGLFAESLSLLKKYAGI